MKHTEQELLVQRIRATLSAFDETRHSDAALVFRVLLLYGGSHTMDETVAANLPSIPDILAVREAIRKDEE